MRCRHGSGAGHQTSLNYCIWIKSCDAQFSRLHHFQQGVIPQLYGSWVFLCDDLSVKRGDAGSVCAMILEIPDSLSISQEVHQPSRDYTPLWDMTNSVGPFSEYNRRAWILTHCYWRLWCGLLSFCPCFIGACCWDTIVRQSVIKSLEIGFWIGDFQSHRLLKLPRTCVLNMSSSRAQRQGFWLTERNLVTVSLNLQLCVLWGSALPWAFERAQCLEGTRQYPCLKEN